jgi:DNA-binding response OmpR family regulator
LSGHRPRILLVEDDRALGAALKFALEVEGYEVDLAETAEALLAHPLPEGPTVLVTDHILPGASGMDAIEALRAGGFTSPAFLMTTGASRRLRARAKAAGACILEKPILGDRIAAAIGGLSSN